MIYSVEDLSSSLESCWGHETVFVRTPKGKSFVINGFSIDESGDVILLTEKMGE